jgi:hypothetical protein
MNQTLILKKRTGSGFFWQAITLILLILAAPATTARAEVAFDYLHGSDLGIGIGARAISMSGAFTAVADDASAVYWNPAGLSQLTGNQVFLSADYPGGFSSAGLIYRPSANVFKSRRLAMGLAVVNRLRFKGDSGDDVWDEYASNILSLAMVDMDDDFSGAIESQTMDIRFSLALVPLNSKRLLLGFNYIHLD